MVESSDKIMGQHDRSYRLFFAHRRMIRDLLREIVGEAWVDRIDFDSGEQVNASFVTDKLEKRESDVIWKFRRTDGKDPVYIYILVEFQSKPDPSMPVRLMGYVSHLYQGLLADQPASAWRKLPLIIPIVIYNGWGPWDVATDLGSLFGDLDPSVEIYRPQLRYRLVNESTYPREELEALNSPVADLFCIEKSRDWLDAMAGAGRLHETIPLTEISLRRAFEAWLAQVILPRFGRSEGDVPITLENVSMLAESIDRWNYKLREEGREEGLEQGRLEGEARVLLRQLQRKFGPLPPEIEARVRSAEDECLLEWSECVLTAERLQDIFGD
jgi:hypothetical protein